MVLCMFFYHMSKLHGISLMKLDTHPVTGEPREYLTMYRKRVKLRTPEAVNRRRRYKMNKPKKQRIRCQECNKRFTPKHLTK
jgi:hypothetical protein